MPKFIGYGVARSDQYRNCSLPSFSFMKIINLRSTPMLVALLLGWLFTLTACGGGGQVDAAKSGAALSGNWQMVMQESPPSLVATTESGFLLQLGNSLAGNVLLSDQTVCAGLGSAQGSVSGSNVALTINQTAQTVSLNGTAVSDGSSMSGNYSILDSGCGGGSTTGTWTANQVQPLKGTFQATFTSGFQGGPVYTFAVMVAQGPNTGASNATLSGTMTSTNAPCANMLTIAGVVSGTSVVFNLLASDGSALGQFRGVTTTDAATLTGTYDFLAEQNICAGDAGLVTMTLQH